MSHFTGLVITAEEPTDDVLERTLCMWQEFECTGKDGPWVQNIDRTAEVNAWLDEACERVRTPSGEVVHPYDNRFYRTPTGKAVTHGYSSNNIREIPSDHVVFETTIRREFGRDIVKLGENISDHFGGGLLRDDANPDLDGAHKYGWTRLRLDTDGNVTVVESVDRTNKKAKWDWYAVGGRWQGLLKTKSGTGGIGRRGTLDAHSGRGGVDWCRKDDLDLGAMKVAQVAKRREGWVKTLEAANKAGLTYQPSELDDMRRAFYRRSRAEVAAWIAAREALEAAPDDTKPKLDRRAHFAEFMGETAKLQGVFGDFGPRTTEDDVEIEAWIASAPPLGTFAVIKDGQWYQRGEMGWWGAVSDEKENDTWEREYETLLNSIPDNHYITIVDFHI